MEKDFGDGVDLVKVFDFGNCYYEMSWGYLELFILKVVKIRGWLRWCDWSIGGICYVYIRNY